MADEARGARPDTRRAILEAALLGFGRRGFEATSTREIAALAKVNVASIAYHFGGKEGLRAACADHIVAALGEVAGGGLPDSGEPDPETARALLLATLRRFVEFLLLRPEAGLIAGFMMREAAQPSEALDVVYSGVIEGAHRRLCRLWGAATGRDPESVEVRLAVFAMVGQVFYFHLARPIVQRRLGWGDYGPDEVEAIAGQLSRNLIARLDAERTGGTEA